MTLSFELHIQVAYGQALYVCGSLSELGANESAIALKMSCVDGAKWTAQVDLAHSVEDFTYSYLIKDQWNNIFEEWGGKRKVQTFSMTEIRLVDEWRSRPMQEFLYTSAFTESFYAHSEKHSIDKALANSVMLNIVCPLAANGQSVAIVGASEFLGEWDISKCRKLRCYESGKWQITIPVSELKENAEYKFLIVDNAEGNVLQWEEGPNRFLSLGHFKGNRKQIEIHNFTFRLTWKNFRAAGVAIPVFSLRTDESCGIGEFPDLLKMVDWAAQTNQKIIQILPVNDTTISGKWTDSYPYSAISIYALHPVYFGIKKHPLNDKPAFDWFMQRAENLNKLSQIDYESVFSLKKEYLTRLFEQDGKQVSESEKFKEFFGKNEYWLFPYACFCYLRDKFCTSEIAVWGENRIYNKEELAGQIAQNVEMERAVQQNYFVQYLLHEQLLAVKEYAHSRGIILKGDIPIGVSRNSVEAWTEPHFFNLDTQTGAPPDDFSVAGQNWGFPTYNWDRMQKDGFRWWKNRFRKMADYFDAYRIDHILGFFRIWEIPQHSVQGLLGYFSPALPFTEDDIRSEGLHFHYDFMTKPYIHEYFLGEIFGDYTSEVVNTFLTPTNWQRFALKDFCDTQQKIRQIFEGKTDEKSVRIRDGLYSLCNEVLFIPDKREPHKFHPRITAQFSYIYKSMDDGQKAAFNRLYDNFFYHRHNDFWYGKAMQKLPAIIAATQMLACGEDLGMIPDCVPAVMRELQILSLEIQRMPKDTGKQFENLNFIPYLSVCTTSTHDMSPLRLWWSENQANTQHFYNEILWRGGGAPQECTAEIAGQIVRNHLASPAMLVILPVQDWLAMSDELKNQNTEEERINVPANPHHYWRYRMHLNVEQLIEAQGFNNHIKLLLEITGRVSG
ncbi:MAG: 4-alpha-glucanotransferase [Prevotellaceae bacterium]|jgi:4-alpha-glucanotransferase|nr:4-alpha-glucanotransferase [Prevotellaceae bacterium]